MTNKLLQSLNIEKGEEKSVFLLLFQSFFIGIFFITMSVSAETLFLQNFPKSEIGKAYALSGVAGIVLTALYSKLQSRISFSKLSIINQLTIGLILFFAWLGFDFFDQRPLIFLLFALMGPLYIIALVNFGGLVLRMFSLRQGKRLFSLVDSGAVFGTIIMGFLTPLLINKLPSTKDLLILSFVSMGMVLFFQFLISNSFDINQENAKQKDETEKINTTKLIFSDRYVRSMAIFTLVTMVALFLIQFLFLSSTSSMYPEENDLAGFLGSFTASMMIFSFLIKTFVYSKLVKNYGLKIAFLIMPLVLVIFSFGAIIAGHIFGYENTSFQFVYFFLLISISKLFSVALKDSIQTPSFKVLYQSLDLTIRYDVQAKIDGIVNEIAATFSGVLLAGLGLLTFLDLIHYGYLTAALCILWSYLALSLYNEYKSSLQRSLETIKTNTDNESELVDYFIGEANKSKNSEINNIARIYNPLSASFNQQNQDKELERISQAKELVKNDIDYVSKVLRSNNIELKIHAAHLIKQHEIISLLPQLMDNVSLNSMKNSIAEIFKFLDKKHVEILHQSSNKTGLSSEDVQFIIRLIGEIKNPESIPFLEKNIDYPDYEVAKCVLYALNQIGYEAQDNNSVKIHQQIDASIQNIGWNIGVLEKVKEDSKISETLKQALKQEIKNGIDLLFLQLSVVYDSKSISHIKENINNGSSESIGFAIELLDLFVIDDLKPKLFPLLEDNAIQKKLEELREHFSIHIDSTEQILKDIINKDYNLTTTYTKACAIDNLATLSEEISIDILANLFNPNLLIRQVALSSILTKSPEILDSIKERLSKERLIEFETQKLKLEESYFHLLLKKIDILSKVDLCKELTKESIEKIASTSDFKIFKGSIDSKYSKLAFDINDSKFTNNLEPNKNYLFFDYQKLNTALITDKSIGRFVCNLLNENKTSVAA